MTKRKGNPYCAHCDITVYHNVAGGVSAVIIRDGRVLLVKRGIEPFKGAYDYAGGFIEPGETAQAAAVREAKEETGLDIELTGLLGVYNDHYEYDTYAVGVFYLAKIIGGQEKAGDDAASLEWHDIDNLPDMALTTGFNGVRQSLRDLQVWYRNQGKK